VVKRIHLASGSAAPIPNGDPDFFFESWLEHGTGGTCWPSTLALHALLVALGFDVRIGSAAMSGDPSPEVHSHGTLLVTTHEPGGDELWWVDTSMLTDEPVPLVPETPTTLDHPLRPVRVEPRRGLWQVHWFSPALGGEMPCRLLDADVTVEHCLDRYEWSRGSGNGPFNQAVFSTRTEANAVRAYAFSELVELAEHGITRTKVAPDDRNTVLHEVFGYSHAILEQLPPDET
jgi:arylamine N-acetyltransferase